MYGAPTASRRSTNRLSSSGPGMEDAVGDGPVDLGFGPRRVAFAKTRCQQLAHGPVHPQGLLHAPLRRHGPVDRHLAFVGDLPVIGYVGDGHAVKLSAPRMLARAVTPDG